VFEARPTSAKHNQLLRIEQQFGSQAKYAAAALKALAQAAVLNATDDGG
jgi:hypothetical protein